MMWMLVWAAYIGGYPVGTDEDAKPAGWALAADPGPAAVRFPEQFPYTELAGIAPRKLYYPAGLTSFLIAHLKLNRNDNFDSLLVGNLTTGKPVGVVRNLEASGTPWQLSYRAALSGDGRTLAVHDSLGKVIRLIEVKTGKERRKLPCADTVSLVFARPDRLLAVRYAAPATVTVWDLAAGKEAAKLQLPSECEDRAGHLTVSPGGRFLAVAASADNYAGSIALFDLDRGTAAGTLWPNGRGQNSARIQALAFAPTGTELAAVVSIPDRVNINSYLPTLIVWNTANGQEATRVPIERGNRGKLLVFGSEPLQWFPDGQAFLIDHRMVTNRADGKLVEFLEYSGDPDAYLAAKVLDDHRLLISTDGNKLVVRRVQR